MIGKTISHYKIIEKIGSGGMGTVYKAEDTKLDRFVALKFLPTHLSQAEEEKKRFIHEAKAASGLQHNNICTIHEINETEDDQMYIVMEWYDGESLKEKIERGPFKVEEALDIASQIAQGLEKAHAKKIVHRDIKPANILITQDGVVKIVDFGLAKLADRTLLTKEGATLGTIGYMSPEQTQGTVVDQRTDIWALGVILYEMLTGERPFKGDYEQAVIYAILNQEPQPLSALYPDLPFELNILVQKLLEKNPDNRLSGMDLFLKRLDSIQKKHETDKTKGIFARLKTSMKMKFVLFISTFVLVILLIYSGFYLFGPSGENIHSIAVLPLENLSGDPEQEYFVDGMTEALITSLSKIGTVKVISRTSSMRYRERNKPLPDIARELNADAVVEGTVLRVGDRVRITTQLIEAATDQHIWAESYERNLGDILFLQSDVSRAIARQIRSQFTAKEKEPLANNREIDPKAYELYLRGRFFLNKYTKEGFLQAFDYFQKAIEKEPNFSLAYVGLAETYVCSEDIGMKRPKEAYPLAKEAVKKALDIDDRLAEAHTGLAQIKFWYEWDWSGSEHELKRAIDLNPSYSAAYIIYSQLLRVQRKEAEQLEKIRRAWELDPLGLYVNIVLGTALFNTGAYDQAIEQFSKTLDLDPDFAVAYWGLGVSYEAKGSIEEAITAFQKAIDLSPGDVHNYADLAHAFALAGKKGEALKILNELIQRSQKTYVPAFVIARIYEGLGDKDAAFEWLEKAYEERSSWIPFVEAMHYFDSIRGDERYSTLLKKIGLP